MITLLHILLPNVHANYQVSEYRPTAPLKLRHCYGAIQIHTVVLEFVGLNGLLSSLQQICISTAVLKSLRCTTLLVHNKYHFYVSTTLANAVHFQ